MLDPAPIGVAALELMEAIEEEHPDARFEDALVIVEVSIGEETLTRWKGTTHRATIGYGLASFAAAGIGKEEDAD